MTERYPVIMDHQAGRQQMQIKDGANYSGSRGKLSSTPVLILMAGGIAVGVGGLFLMMMVLTLLASVTLLLVTSPLLLIFSPVLLGAGCIFAFAMAGFALAACLGFAGLSSISRAFSTGRILLGLIKSSNDDDDVMNKGKLKMDIHNNVK